MLPLSGEPDRAQAALLSPPMLVNELKDEKDRALKETG